MEGFRKCFFYIPIPHLTIFLSLKWSFQVQSAFEGNIDGYGCITARDVSSGTTSAPQGATPLTLTLIQLGVDSAHHHGGRTQISLLVTPLILCFETQKKENQIVISSLLTYMSILFVSSSL